MRKRKPELVEDWQVVIRKAWSFKLFIVAALFSAAEYVVPLYAQEMPRGLFAIVTFVVTIAGAVSRILAQRSMKNADR